MKIRLVICLACVAVPFFSAAAGVEFLRTLRVGMQGDDVRAMQQTLNKDPDTRIAESGAGAPGSETDYFGPATKRALIRFQEKYRTDVLAPIGLVGGTGVFGEKTRIKLSSVRQAISVQEPLTSATATLSISMPSGVGVPSGVIEYVEQGEVFVVSLSRYSGKYGAVVTMGGYGFARTGNTIYIGDGSVVEHVPSWNGQTMNFEVPNIAKGLYHLWVKNARGESDHSGFFVVTDGVTPEPKIDSVDYFAGRGTVIKGSGFATTGNMVRTGVGVYEDISSPDGKTIIVSPATTLSSFSKLPTATIFVDAPKEIKPIFIPVSVFVINENGVSNSKNFTLEM